MNGLGVPKLREFQRPWTMAISLLDLNQNPLEMFGVVVGVVKRQGNALAFQLLFIHNGGFAVYPLSIIDAGNVK